MKDTLSMAISIAAFAFVGVRLYQKYVKKDKNQPGQTKKPTSSLFSGSKDDDYEPYSRK